MRILNTTALGNDRWRSVVQRLNGSSFAVDHKGLVIPPFTDWAGLYDTLLDTPEYLEINALRLTSVAIEQCVVNFGLALVMLTQEETPTRRAGFEAAKLNLIAMLPEIDRSRIESSINAAIQEHSYGS